MHISTRTFTSDTITLQSVSTFTATHETTNGVVTGLCTWITSITLINVYTKTKNEENSLQNTIMQYYVMSIVLIYMYM